MIENIGVIVGWVGLIASAFGGIVLGIRALIRGPKEDRVLEMDLQERESAYADKVIKRFEERLERAEQRAERAEQRAADLAPRVADLEGKLMQALVTIEEMVAAVPAPTNIKLPAWIFDWVHREKRH